MTERSHKIVITKSEQEDIIAITCDECGGKMNSPTEYHPKVFCELTEKGIDPWEVMRRAHVAQALGRGR